MWSALALAGIAVPLLLTGDLTAVLTGMVLMGVGTFFAQATATGFVGRAATTDRGSASGLYLASYFLGGLAGSAVLGQVFDRLGWTACVIGISLLLGALLATRFIAHSHRPDAATAFQFAKASVQGQATH
jgi:predicted MFS family arabinose efflux permease